MSSPEVISLRDYAVKSRPREVDQAARQFLPAALEVLETPASPVGRAIGGTIILAFAATIVWATFGYVDIVAKATGKIVPAGRTKTIQPLESGVVSAIRVRDGDKVNAGQVLIELDRTASDAEREHIANDLVAFRLDIARLSALKMHHGGPIAPGELLAPKGATDRDVARARDWMLVQAAEQRSKVASITQQIEQKAAEYEQVRTTIEKIAASLPFVDEGATIRRRAMEIQYGNRVAYLDAQTKLIELQHEELVQKRKLVELTAARMSLEAQRDQAVAAYAHKISSDLADADKKAEGLRQDLVKAERRVEERVLRSPIDGTVQQLSVFTIGGVVTPAQQLMIIVPDNSALEIDATITNSDIGFVQEGQPAEIKIDTFNFTRYGLLHGKVMSISQDAVVRERPATERNDQKSQGSLAASSEPKGQELSYSARVSLDQIKMLVDNRSVNLAPGMAATVEIKTGSRRLIEYVLSPIVRYKQESMRER